MKIITLFLFLVIQGCAGRGSDNTGYYMGTTENGGLVSITLFSEGKVASTYVPDNSRRDNFEAIVLEGKDKDKTLSTGFTINYETQISTFDDNPQALALYGPFLIYRHTALGNFGIALWQTSSLNQDPPRPVATLSKVDGLYNYVSKDKTGIGYGTLKIDAAANTWTYWIKENASATNPKGHFSGSLSEKENYAVEAIVNEIAPSADALLNKNGLNVSVNSKFANIILSRDLYAQEHLLVVDLVALEGFALGAKQKEVKQGHFDAKYQILSTAESNIISAAIDQTNATISTKKMGIQFNKPWTGFINDGAQFYGLLSREAYFAIDGSAVFAGTYLRGQK